MKNIDINEWLLNNDIDPLIEIIADGKQWFLSDILEKHLKEQFAIHGVVGRSEQLKAFADWRDNNEDWIMRNCHTNDDVIKEYLKSL